jgi:hypothetical protein
MFRMMNRKLLVMGLVVAAVLAFNLSTVAAMQIGVQVAYALAGNPQMGDSIPWLPAVAAVVALAVLVVLGLGRKKK